MHHHPHTHAHSRRDFFSRTFGGILAGATIVEEAFLRASWARAQSATTNAQLFRIEKVADNVYAALARPQALTNCNAAIFVNTNDVLVVDAHSKPSAAAALIAQIKKEVTPKPVRYLVNTHFHWDHTQGDAAYKTAGGKLDIIASDTTKQLMIQLQRDRLKESVEAVPKQIDGLKQRLARAKSPADQEFCKEQIRQLEAYVAEMKSAPLEQPTISFAKSYVIQDRAGDLHLEFRGKAHTSGDIAVFSPQKRVIASGDMISGFLPNMGDGYPKPWPKTIDSVGQLGFDKLICGHGPVQPDRARMIQLRNYVDDLTGLVENGKKAGKPLAELQKAITVTSVKSLQSNGYANYIADNLKNYTIYLGQKTPLEERLAGNIEAIYNRLDLV
jgi:cyclase